MWLWAAVSVAVDAASFAVAAAEARVMAGMSCEMGAIVGLCASGGSLWCAGEPVDTVEECWGSVLPGRDACTVVGAWCCGDALDAVLWRAAAGSGVALRDRSPFGMLGDAL